MLQTFDSAPIGKFHIFSRVELSMISSGPVLLNDGVFRQTLRVQLGMQFAANTGGQTPRNAETIHLNLNVPIGAYQELEQAASDRPLA